MSDKPKEAETMDAQKFVDDVEKWRAALAQPQNDAPQITMADIRKHAGDGMLSSDDVINAANTLLQERWPQNDAEAVAFMFWNEPDTQRHFSQLRGEIGSYWANVVPLYTAPPSPERMREALEICRDAIAGSIDTRGIDSGGILLGALSVADRALSRAGDNHASDGKYDPAFVASILEADAKPPEAVFGNIDDTLAYLNKSDNHARKLPSDDLGLPLERVRTEAARMGYALVPNDREAIARIIDPKAFEDGSVPSWYILRRYMAHDKADAILALRESE